MDSAYYAAEVIAAIRRQGARFSVTAPMNSKIKAAVAGIAEDAWTPIKYPRAIWDDQLGCWVSDAESPKPSTPDDTALGEGSGELRQGVTWAGERPVQAFQRS
jgi:hypothetical protein